MNSDPPRDNVVPPDLLATGPQLASAVEALGWPAVGRSRAGRKVVARWWGPPAAQHSLLIIGGIHGDEPSSVSAVLDFAAYPTACDGAFPGPLSRWGVCVVPVLNPDGIAEQHKNNVAEVDLNRNFPARNFTTDHAPGYDPGTHPLSEPESACLAELVAAHAVRAVVAVHAPLACVNFDGPAAGWAAHVSDACGWPVRSDIGYPTPGSLGSWLGCDQGLPVLTLELPPGGYLQNRISACNALRAAMEFALNDGFSLQHGGNDL